MLKDVSRTHSSQTSVPRWNSDQSLLQRKLVQPVLALLQQGMTPEKLAWSLAAGLAIGINPLLGSTTVLCLLAAFVFRLNVVASQLANHVSYPLELLLLIPLIRTGAMLFHTPPLPLAPDRILHASRTNLMQTTEMLWMWEWHALVVWAMLSAVLVPALALTLKPLLRQALRKFSKPAAPPVIASPS